MINQRYNIFLKPSKEALEYLNFREVWVVSKTMYTDFITSIYEEIYLYKQIIEKERLMKNYEENFIYPFRSYSSYTFRNQVS
jgi:hypothetical protein